MFFSRLLRVTSSENYNHFCLTWARSTDPWEFTAPSQIVRAQCTNALRPNTFALDLTRLQWDDINVHTVSFFYIFPIFDWKMWWVTFCSFSTILKGQIRWCAVCHCSSATQSFGGNWAKFNIVHVIFQIYLRICIDSIENTKVEIFYSHEFLDFGRFHPPYWQPPSCCSLYISSIL